MAEITSLSSDHWATTEDVRELVKIPQKGGEKDFERAIERATDTVQSWYQDYVGDTDLPDASSLDPLLVQATAYYAAFESHFAFSWNFRSDGEDSTGPRSADEVAKDKFFQWADTYDVQSPSDSGDSGEPPDYTARSGSLTEGEF